MPNTKIKSLVDFDKKDKKRSWKVILDGKELQVKERLSLVSNDYGRFEYAYSPLGHDAVYYRFSYKGGVVIVPYSIINNQLYIGFILQERPNERTKATDHMVLNLPRGFVDEGESFLESGKRETMEELEIKVDSAKFKFERLSKALNPDSGLYDTAETPDTGVSFFSLEIDPHLLIKTNGCYKFIDKIHARHIKNPAQNEHILGSFFYEWTKVFEVTDTFSLLGVLLLKNKIELKLHHHSS